MNKFVLREKSFNFALRCIKLYNYLRDNKREYIISKQLLRSGTAIGAMIIEGKQAESKADFIHKYAIALKECNETIYWLKLLFHSSYIAHKAYESIENDACELQKMLSSSIITAKKSIRK
jgi:four helix bundle protein